MQRCANMLRSRRLRSPKRPRQTLTSCIEVHQKHITRMQCGEHPTNDRSEHNARVIYSSRQHGQYGPSRTLDCVSAPLVDKMLVCLPRMGFPDAERQSILSLRDRASGKLSLHDTDGMWVSNMYVIHFGS